MNPVATAMRFHDKCDDNWPASAHQDLRPIAILYRRSFTYFSNHLFVIFRKVETFAEAFS